VVSVTLVSDKEPVSAFLLSLQGTKKELDMWTLIGLLGMPHRYHQLDGAKI